LLSSSPIPAPLPEAIVDACGSRLITASGRELVDLFSAYGAVWLGHAHAGVRDALLRQAGSVWAVGGHPHHQVDAALQTLEAWLPAGMRCAQLYSTGMEAVEFALRVARVHSGRLGVLGFAGSMHGKSMATAALGWDNGDGLQLPAVQRLGFGPGMDEAAVLAQAEQALRSGEIGLVLVEPLQGTQGGWSASPGFYTALAGLTRAQGALLAYDEVLTGFHRLGPRFAHELHGVRPDLLVFGKACGNGFPIAGLAADQGIGLRPAMLPGSTFSGNPLAAAVLQACLQAMGELPLRDRVEAMGAVAAARLAPLRALGHQVRGGGALWVITPRDPGEATAMAAALYQAGICVSYSGQQLRLLPAVTLALPDWEDALDRLVGCLQQARGAACS
jgi:acetylornithine/succinyldiaminopimelate/putrescine aminotransferase